MSVSLQTFACDKSGVYEGDVDLARELTNKSLICNYNGMSSKATLTLSTPRCLGTKSQVKLFVFDDEHDVLSIRSKTIHGIAKYTTEYRLETIQADFGFICEIQE